MLTRSTPAFAQQSAPLSAGDIAILQFLAAGEAPEVDFFTQYNELAGIQNSEVSGGSGNWAFQEKLTRINPNIPQYIHDNTDDEMSHQSFINAYLVANGASAVNLERYRTLQGSSAAGTSGMLRLTNLTQLTLDTSWWTRYLSRTNNPDVNPITFEQAIPDLHNGQFTAIPMTDDDLLNGEHLQAIANTAVFHMATVEQGGGSLRLALAQRATSVEVLRLLISMGPIESLHFQTWHQVAGGVRALIDPTNNLTFPDLNNGVDRNTGATGAAVRDMFQSNLIMPEPCPFINGSLPVCR